MVLIQQQLRLHLQLHISKWTAFGLRLLDRLVLEGAVLLEPEGQVKLSGVEQSCRKDLSKVELEPQILLFSQMKSYVPFMINISSLTGKTPRTISSINFALLFSFQGIHVHW